MTLDELRFHAPYGRAEAHHRMMVEKKPDVGNRIGSQEQGHG
jgi:hypothetical protein